MRRRDSLSLSLSSGSSARPAGLSRHVDTADRRRHTHTAGRRRRRRRPPPRRVVGRVVVVHQREVKVGALVLVLRDAGRLQRLPSERARASAARGARGRGAGSRRAAPRRPPRAARGGACSCAAPCRRTSTRRCARAEVDGARRDLDRHRVVAHARHEDGDDHLVARLAPLVAPALGVRASLQWCSVALSINFLRRDGRRGRERRRARPVHVLGRRLVAIEVSTPWWRVDAGRARRRRACADVLCFFMHACSCRLSSRTSVNDGGMHGLAALGASPRRASPSQYCAYTTRAKVRLPFTLRLRLCGRRLRNGSTLTSAGGRRAAQEGLSLRNSS